jgi:hypothetical protein
MVSYVCKGWAGSYQSTNQHLLPGHVGKCKREIWQGIEEAEAIRFEEMGWKGLELR